MKAQITLSFLLYLLPIIGFSQWNVTSINTPTCVSPQKQVDPRMSEDGKGGAYITWKDFRNGSSNPDIFIQRIDKDGMVLWAQDGVPLCTQTSDQSTPSITKSTDGGAIVAWSDWRSGIERDLYAQKVDSNGVIQWQLDGAIVSNKNEREHNEKVASDSKGGVIVAWEQQNTNGFWDVWAQRLDKNGQRKWGNGGIPISSSLSNKINVKVQKDEYGGAFLVWQDFRNNIDYDIYGQRLDSNGVRLWGNSDVAICSNIGAQNNPKIDPDSATNGIYIVWVDDRNGDNDIYGQRLTGTGSKLWGVSGAAITNAVGNQSAPDMVSNSSIGGGLVATWKDDRNGNMDIYAQRLRGNGTPLWAVNGIPVSNTPLTQLNPNICSDKFGGVIIAWQDSLATGWDIKSQRLNNDGQALWLPNGSTVSNATGKQSGVKNISDDTGGSIYVWEDYRTGTRDIYVHRLTGIGYNLAVTPSMAGDDLYCFPNPFEDKLEIQLKNTDNFPTQLQLLDVKGQEVFAQALTPSSYVHGSIFLSQLDIPTGVYILRLSGAGFAYHYKLIRAAK